MTHSGAARTDDAVPRAQRAAEDDGRVHRVAAHPEEHCRVSVHDDARKRAGKAGS